MIDFDIPKQRSSIIKVIGVGGGGGNAVNHMFLQKIENVDFIICNTDAQALENSAIPNKIQLGPHLTQGLGAGANPEVGRQATEESLEEIKRILEVNTKMAFICAGMGGGTGTGGGPIIAKICQELGILTVGIVTTPFSFEGPRRKQQAENGIKELEPHVDTLLVISNDKLRMQHKNLKMREAFGKADDVLSTAAKCITDIINSNGQINVDFADVCTVMRKGGVAILGSAIVEGEDRAQLAIENAINSPLLNDNNINGAKWILLNINTSAGDYECGTDEFELINDHVRNMAGENTDVIVGMGIDNSLGNSIAVTLIATGFEHKDPFEEKPDFESVPEKDKVILTLKMNETASSDAGESASEEKEEKTTEKPAEKIEMPTVVELSPAEEEMNDILYQAGNETINSEESIIFSLEEDSEENKEEIPEQKKVEVVDQESQLKYEEKPTETVQPNHSFLSKPNNIYASHPKVEQKPKEDVKKPQPSFPMFPQEEEMQIVFKENKNVILPSVPLTNAAGNEDLSEEELKKRKAEERIQKLRNLSYNIQGNDIAEEYETVPAYVRRNLEMLNNSQAGSSAESYYSKYTVNKDEKEGINISGLNAFLEGKKPD
ncbi:cell division protein FtsZ [Arachidicoccus sp.]|uniref:cell division protein FtsZ n=1 Tax=Arachidicoccus sp. TaxID=1872624 RepID=UPI003D229F0C